MSYINKIFKGVAKFVLLLLTPLLMLVAAIAGLFSKPFERTRGEVADIIERFINGSGSDYEWDDFVCVPIADPDLENIRQRCNGLDREFPPEKVGEFTNSQGELLLRGFVQQLRTN